MTAPRTERITGPQEGMMRKSRFVGSAFVACVGALELAASAGGAAGVAAPQPVAVELFTSQGCSSCPPADAVMEKLARDRNVVAISRPVTYWDNGGWKDTLAKPANTELQRGYARRKFAGAGVYTPQMVIEGRAGAVGGREDQVRHLIAQAAGLPQPMLAITPTREGGRTIRIAGRPSGTADLILIALRGPVTVAVGSGENGGRRVTYVNTVVSKRTLGQWAGGVKTVSVPRGALHVAGAARYALLVRQGAAGPILAARYL